MLSRLKTILLKELIQIRRDPRMMAVILAVPVIQSLVFGYAVTTDVRNISTAIYDLDRTTVSRDLLSRFTGSGYFRATSVIGTDAEAKDLLDRGEVKVVLHVPAGFASEVMGDRTGKLQLLIDGSDSNTAGIILSYAAAIAARWNQDLLVQSVPLHSRSSAMRLKAEVRAWFNPNLESRNFYVPGVVALLVTLITLMLTGMAIVREKEIGTMEQIIVTPITKVEFILGKTLPFAAIAFFDVLVIAVVAVFWFDVPIRGSLLLLLAATAVYLMSTIGTGLFISTVSRTQQQAMMTTFFFFMPAVLLSGFIFPIANMPLIIQWITLLDPLRYYLVIIRGIFLKGTGAAVLWPQIAALAVLGFVALTLATRRFNKTLT